MRRKGSQILWETLVREGVEVVFGYPGGAILPVYDAMLDYPVRHVLARHEQGAAHMADGYARATGNVGVALATSGPGATNLVTGIATAMMDSSPMVCITGQVPRAGIGSDAFQETDVTGVTLPITKHNYLVTDAADIESAVREAFYIARSGRPGPVLVDIAKDAQQTEIEWSPDLEPVRMPGYRPDLTAPDAEFQRAAELINEAERPIVLGGHGIMMSGAEEAVRTFVEKANVPVGMTLLGLGGLPIDHRLNQGMMGMHGEAWVNQAIQEADLLIALGMRFDDRVTGNLKSYAPNARKIHVDIDPTEIDKNVRVDVGIVGDLRATIERLMPLVESRPRTNWLDRLSSLRGEASVRDIQRLPDNGHLYAAHVINDLSRHTDGGAIIVTDVGQHQMWAAQYYKHNFPMHHITSGGLGTMGFALPAGIGAKFGQPDEQVWVIVGDGGFQMTAQELSTCAQEHLDLNVAIINNNFLGMVRQWQEFFYDKRYSATPMLNPDFVKLAEAHGLRGLRCDTRGEVDEVIRAAESTPGTVVVDFRVEQEDTVYPMVPTGNDLKEMIRRPQTADPLVETADDAL
ncbi:MAG: biosynthetic-type acetolactate synthase large subunit [Spirochaetaceae bacterium]